MGDRIHGQPSGSLRSVETVRLLPRACQGAGTEARGRKGATPGLSNLAAIIISILKLSVVFIILFVVIKWGFVHIFGLVGGLSLCFLAILWEGVTLMKQTSQGGE